MGEGGGFGGGGMEGWGENADNCKLNNNRKNKKTLYTKQRVEFNLLYITLRFYSYPDFATFASSINFFLSFLTITYSQLNLSKFCHFYKDLCFLLMGRCLGTTE